MKIHYLSDLHLEFNRNINDFQIPQINADVIVLAGDIGLTTATYFKWVLSQTKGTPTIMVLGNHEHYNGEYYSTINKWSDAFKGTNVLVLENESVDIDGVTFLGVTLWTDYLFCGVEGETIIKYIAESSMNDHRCISIETDTRKKRFYPDDAQTMHRQSLAFFEEIIGQSRVKKTVVVTHHAPSRHSVAPIYKDDNLNAAFASHLDKWIEKYQPTAWIHGHMHNSFDYMVGDTQVVCNPRGYAPYELNTKFSNSSFIEI